MVQEAFKEFFKIKMNHSHLRRRDAKCIDANKTTQHLRDM